MNFLYPYFLYGLFAVSIPIIIHFFNFQRPKKILFTNVSFLQQVNEATRSRLKVKHILALIFRVLFITFLVLAFAQPFLQGENASEMTGQKTVSVYLDNSLSMENEVEEERALDIGIKSVSSLGDIYSPDTRFLFLNNEFSGKDQVVRNKDKLQERLTEQDYSNMYRSFESIHNRQLNLVKRNPSDKNHIFWFSDFQQSTSGDIQSLKPDSTLEYYLVPIQNTETSNLYIDSVWLPNPLIKEGEVNHLKVNVYNSGSEPVNNLVLKLFLDGVQVSSAGVDVPAEMYAETEFNFTVSGNQERKGIIKFEEHPVSFDNAYYFVLNPSPKVNVVHLSEKSAGTFFDKVYSNESIFNLNSTNVGQVDYSSFNTADLVVLDGISSIPSSLEAPLKKFVYQGGALMVIPSVNPDIPNYQNILSGFFPDISGVESDTSERTKYTLLPPDAQNPFFRNVFEKDPENVSMPYSIPVLDPGRAGTDILKYRNGQPFLSMAEASGGSVYLMASPLNNRYSSFHLHSVFVPVMYKIGFNSILRGEQLAYSFQDPIVKLDIPEESSGEVYQLISEKSSYVPDQKVIEKSLVLDLPKEDMQPGFYSLETKDGKEIKTLAVNYGKNESEMEFFTASELKNIFADHKNVHIYDITSTGDFSSAFTAENVGVPLWKLALLIALLFLLAEVLVIRFV